MDHQPSGPKGSTPRDRATPPPPGPRRRGAPTLGQRAAPLPGERARPGKGGRQGGPGRTPAAAAPQRRWLFLTPPPRAHALAGWALLPLRAFLGVTFLYAGLQKLANPNFFDANSPVSIQAQIIAAERTSPLHSLLGHFVQFSTAVGVAIALGEIAVGLGALLGLWTRLAALGGLVLSLTLFLTVSFHSSPYYTGADIVFLLAWTPLVLAGSGGVLSVDGVVEARTLARADLGPSARAALSFSTVQRLCGNYDLDRCRALQHDPCDIGRCPVLAEDRVHNPLSRGPDEIQRRQVVLGGLAAAVAAGAGVIGAAAAAGIGRAVGGTAAPPPSSVDLPRRRSSGQGGTTSTTSPPGATTPTAARPPGTAIGAGKDVPTGGAARFTDPVSGDPALVLQPTAEHFVAYDAVCPHAGCTVGYARSSHILVCPCHGSQFNASTGAVEVGPAATGLRRITVAEGPDGQLYVQ